MENVEQVLVLHQEDRELPLWERDLVMEEADDHSLFVPANKWGI